MVISASAELEVGVPLNVDDVEVSKMGDPGLQLAHFEPSSQKSEDPVSRTTSKDRGLLDG